MSDKTKPSDILLVTFYNASVIFERVKVMKAEERLRK